MIAQAAAVMVWGVLCILPIGAHAFAENATKYKEYAATKTDSIIELYAMDVLYTAESNWRVKAVNGTHFGICQGKSKYLQTANYKQQIDWCYRYAIKRYGSIVYGFNGSAGCNDASGYKSLRICNLAATSTYPSKSKLIVCSLYRV